MPKGERGRGHPPPRWADPSPALASGPGMPSVAGGTYASSPHYPRNRRVPSSRIRVTIGAMDNLTRHVLRGEGQVESLHDDNLS